jgi:hypothetical protein
LPQEGGKRKREAWGAEVSGFFEKKNQKTFGPGGMGYGQANAHGPAIKVFLLLFVHKKKRFLA